MEEPEGTLKPVRTYSTLSHGPQHIQGPHVTRPQLAVCPPGTARAPHSHTALPTASPRPTPLAHNPPPALILTPC